MITSKISDSEIVRVQFGDKEVYIAERNGGHRLYNPFLNGFTSTDISERTVEELGSRADTIEPTTVVEI